MKKTTRLLVIVVLVAGCALAGLHVWLQSTVESLARETIAQISLLPGSVTGQGSVESVHFSPLSRTLQLRGVRVTDATGSGLTGLLEDVTLRFTPQFLCALTPLRGLVMPKQSETLLPVIEHVQATGIDWKTAEAHSTVKMWEGDKLRIVASLLTRLLDGQKIDPLDVVYSGGADSLRTQGMVMTPTVNVSTDASGQKSASDTELSEIRLDETTVTGWERGTCQAMHMGTMHGMSGSEEIFFVQSLDYGTMTLPPKDLVERLWQEVLAHREDSDALVDACTPLLKQMQEGKPLVEKVRLGEVRCLVEGQMLRLAGAGYDYPTSESRRVAAFVQGLLVPQAALKESGLLLPDMVLDVTASIDGYGSGDERHAYQTKISGLANVDVAFLLHGTGPLFDEQALARYSVSDVRVVAEDKGALAWVGRNMGGDPAAVPQRLERALAEVEWKETPENERIMTDLLAFMHRPGTLELQTTAGERLGMLRLLEALANPGAILTLQVRPGNVSLEDAIRALPAMP